MNRLISLRTAARRTNTLCTRRRIATAIQPKHRASSLNTIFPSSISTSNTRSNTGAGLRKFSSLNTNFYTPNIETSKQQNTIVTLASFPYVPELLVGIGVLYATGIGSAMFATTLAKTEKLHLEHLEQKSNLYFQGVGKLENEPEKAYELFKQAADKFVGFYSISNGQNGFSPESDILHAQYLLGCCYVDGIGVKKNESKGFSLMFDAVEKDTNRMHINGLWGRHQPVMGAQGFQGLIEACYHNGDTYNGQLVNNKNQKKVFDLITKLALHKDGVCLAIKMTAMIELGYIYNKGLLDVEIDETKGSEYYAKAMDLKNAFYLDWEKARKERYPERSYKEFLKMMLYDPKIYLIQYLFGLKWIEKDETKAFHLYTKTMDILQYLIESKEASEDEIQALKKLADSHLLSWQNSKTR
jgi:TPR repeat protein